MSDKKIVPPNKEEEKTYDEKDFLEILKSHESRITQLEATLYRLRNNL